MGYILNKLRRLEMFQETLAYTGVLIFLGE